MASENGFVDYYEVLQLSQQADAETIERVFRLLAKRYHPDNGDSGDDEKFREVHNAYQILNDPERRAEFDVHYDRNKSLQWKIFNQNSAIGSREDDQRIFNGVLSLLYVARRNNPESGGLGALHLERMLGVPREHLEFPLWVLKKRGWLEVLDTGQYAITIDGIEMVMAEDLAPPDDRLLTETANGVDESADETEPVHEVEIPSADA